MGQMLSTYQRAVQELVNNFDMEYGDAQQEMAPLRTMGRRELRVVRNPETTQIFFLLASLGEGAFGGVYKAASNWVFVPDYVVKEFRLDAESGRERSNVIKSLEREFTASQIVRRRLGNEWCADNAVCAFERFYNPRRTRAYITFPYDADATDLETYMKSVMYPRMRTWLQWRKAARLDTLSIPELYTMARDNEEDDTARELVKVLSGIQSVLVRIFGSICQIVEELHAHSVIHMDLKPANVLIVPAVDTVGVKLIDFGLACVENVEDDPDFTESEREVVDCGQTYFGTPDFRDPLADHAQPTTMMERLDAFTKFDVYSVAKVGIALLDQALVDPARYPIVRETPFMPHGLVELFEDMTGERNVEPTIGQYGLVELTAADKAVRVERFADRPSMEDVTAELWPIVAHWMNDRSIAEGMN